MGYDHLSFADHTRPVLSGERVGKGLGQLTHGQGKVGSGGSWSVGGDRLGGS